MPRAARVGHWRSQTPGTVVAMRPLQGTVATFDAETHAGTVLLDNGAQVSFSDASFAASGLRLLRPGQRVRLERDEKGVVTKVTLVTLA